MVVALGVYPTDGVLVHDIAVIPVVPYHLCGERSHHAQLGYVCHRAQGSHETAIFGVGVVKTIGIDHLEGGGAGILIALRQVFAVERAAVEVR